MEAGDGHDAKPPFSPAARSPSHLNNPRKTPPPLRLLNSLHGFFSADNTIRPFNRARILLLLLSFFFILFTMTSLWLWHVSLPPSSSRSPPLVSLSVLPKYPSGVSLSISSTRNSMDDSDGDDDDGSKLCPSGRVYIYDLPSEFNAELLRSCSSLVPWTDMCPSLDNNGAGISVDMPFWMGGTGFWFLTSQFGGEVIFHSRLLLHPCRTMDPQKASAFFIPFYTGLDIARYLFAPGGSTPSQRDELSHRLLDWLKQQETWKRRNGRDHFLMVGRITWDFRRESSGGWLWRKLWPRSAGGWGNDLFLTKEMERGPLRLIIEKSISDKQEMAIPYPTSFHPRSSSDVARWQEIVRSSRRTLLFSYAGGPRPQFPNDFRSILLDQCRDSSPSECRSMDCTDQKCEHPLAVMELFLDSVFCLQPRGDSLTRRSIFDAMIAGCIPVFFWKRTAYLQYQWHLPSQMGPDSYSVFIDRAEVKSGKRRIRDVLLGFSERKVRRMRETLIASIPRFAYALPSSSSVNFTDAFDIALDQTLNLLRQRSMS